MHKQKLGYWHLEYKMHHYHVQVDGSKPPRIYGGPTLILGLALVRVGTGDI